MAKGGTGGGAIKITAGGTLTVGADIFASGGQGGSHAGDITDGMNGVKHFWFDASDENTVIKDANGKVSFWNDKISNKHLAQATTANQPTYGTRTYNGLPVMDFDGGDMMETINNVDMATDHRNPKRVGRNFQLWVVAYVDSVDHENDSIFAYRENDRDYQFDAGHASNFYARMNCDSTYGASTTFSNGTDLKGTPLVILIDKGNTVYINGISKGSLSSSGTAYNDQIKFLVGSNRGGDQFYRWMDW